MIVIHNEAWCSLIRTIYSVLETTPRILLKEIILVDDKSQIDQRPEVGQKLDDFIEENFDPLLGEGYVRILRQPERLGLIQASSF